MAAPGVHAAAANDLTGNVLVHFDSARTLDTIIGLIVRLLRGEEAGDERIREDSAWHCDDPDHLEATLETSSHSGLSDEAASARLARVGRNALPEPALRSRLSIFASQFQGTPVALLAAASILSLGMGAFVETGAILGVVVLNGVIGFATESRAERTIQSLGQLGPQSARVIRGGRSRLVPAETVVPGDLLCLQHGDIVSADARLVSASALTVNEASLTGESLPVAKAVTALRRGDVPVAERINMVYSGSVVTGGSGVALVVATGLHTEIGRVQRMVGSVDTPQTPMQRQLKVLGRQIAWASLGVAGVMFGIGALRGYALLQLLHSVASLAVAAVPEGLPVVATTILAFGIDEMRRRKVLVRRLDAIETLASASVVCFDKTGTLTLNRMSVESVAIGAYVQNAPFDIGSAESEGKARPEAARLERLLEIGSLCSETQIEELGRRMVINGSATESALVQAALDAGIDVQSLRRKHALLSTQHRTEMYRFMATIHADDHGGALVAVKGDPLEVLSRCSREEVPDGARDLTRERRAEIERANTGLADQALRVLGFACKSLEETPARCSEIEPDDLTWVGLAGMADPVRPGLRDLMAALHRAGLHTLMMTGDQSTTARAVARQVGLANGEELTVIDAPALDLLSSAQLAAAVRRGHVFARVSPAQKLRLIRAYQDEGGVVAMVGDGINDSPALKAADVGIALGKDGTTAARDVADVVLETDDLTGLLDAIESGRTTCVNVRKSIHYLLSTNLSECLVMLAAIAGGIPSALSPLQLLWLNLVTDVLPSLGLALEPSEPDVLRGAPQASDQLILPENRTKLARQAAMLSAGPLAACAFGAWRYGGGAAQTQALTLGSMVTAQLLHAVSCRSDEHSVFRVDRLPPNRALTYMLGASLAAQLGALAVPGLRRLLGLQGVGPLDLLIMLAGGLLPFLANEALKGTPVLDVSRQIGDPSSRNYLGMPKFGSHMKGCHEAGAPSSISVSRGL